MAKTSKRPLPGAECAERRARDRDRLRTATEELLSSAGWQRWVRTNSFSSPRCQAVDDALR